MIWYWYALFALAIYFHKEPCQLKNDSKFVVLIEKNKKFNQYE